LYGDSIAVRENQNHTKSKRKIYDLSIDGAGTLRRKEKCRLDQLMEQIN